VPSVSTMNNLSTITAPMLFLTGIFLSHASGADSQLPSRKETPQTEIVTLTKSDEQAIRKTVMGFESAWNAHDMKSLGQLFREDAEFINVVGMHWRGRPAIQAAHAAFHETSFKDCRLKTDSIAIRPLGNDHAIAVVVTTQDGFTTPAGQVMPKGQTKQSYVMARGIDGWQIAHGQNVRIDAEAVQHDPVNRAVK